ncbi:MAG: bifunctional (p)ppGpp synthetase/guanosine-3',5'-bis(diphosphate) 3'-pyrophosphohydrolase [Clostridiales bacterium]|nr:bifunctional (p)ppGpp synthetase/guanosine-3',5'-bis(diphosphate) 3'-pyrophosphohydrolase [Clostridiales bacterium]
MRQSFDNSVQEFKTPEDGLKILFGLLGDSCSEDDIAIINKAYHFADSAHNGQKRLSGEPYINHPINVAIIVATLGMDTTSVIAALLHDTVEDTYATNEIIRKEFGQTVSELVDGLSKISGIRLPSKGDSDDSRPAEVVKTREQQQAENVRKMLLAMSQDVRVIIIKLADRLHNMRTLQFKPENRRREIARETIEIYAPLAHRLGIRTIKEELEDLSISYLDPVAYSDIEKSLDKQRSERSEFLAGIKERITERVLKSLPKAEVSGRVKSVHGIYRKMYMQNKNFDEIYDIYALRIIVDTLTDCYYCLGIIHDMYKPIPGRFKDYISNPKANMYQSLHTTVIGKEGVPFEVQIRTWEMHYTAEYGVAAHWKYKLGISSKQTSSDEKLSWVRQLLESQGEGEDVENIVSTIKSDLVPEEVFVFTPKGDVFSLPTGATVIDFAYAVHSAVGNKMIGAKVDGRIVPLDYKVKTGEIVDIMTSSQPGKGPSRDWLNIVKTSQARTKIRQWFKKEKREENIAEGKAEVEREFRRNSIRLDEDEMNEFLSLIVEKQHCNSVDDFLAGIGYGGISLVKLMPRIKDEYQRRKKTQTPAEDKIIVTQKKAKSKEGVVVEGIDNCLFKFSKCCTPLPGDEIIGFITRGHGVSIHTRRCSNVPVDISKSNEPERWIKAYWEQGSKTNEQFNCTLTLYCMNRIGLLADISSTLANMHIMINDVNLRTGKNNTITLYLTVSVNGVEHLNSVIPKLAKVNGVVNVERQK